VNGQALREAATPADARALGIALVPGDRLREGGVPGLDLRENVLLPQPRIAWRRSLARPLVDDVVSLLGIVPADPRAAFAAFSGGNQQKAIVGRALSLKPRVMLLVQPTAGVDSVTRRNLHAMFASAAELGVGVLLFSSELEELAALSDRVLFVAEGRIAESAIAKDQLTVEALAQTLHANG
jgi:ABC-type sugar transport system ATPase subunit